MLFDQLHDLGAALPESARPSPNAVANLIAGLVFYIETGTLTPPEPEPVPSPAEAAAISAENQHTAELESRLAQMEQQLAAKQAGPSPVLPPPTGNQAAVETPASPAGEAPAQPGPEAAPAPWPGQSGGTPGEAPPQV